MNTFLATTTLPVPLMQTNPSFLQCKREATFSRTIFHTVYLALLRYTTAILNYTKQLIKVQSGFPFKSIDKTICKSEKWFTDGFEAFNGGELF